MFINVLPFLTTFIIMYLLIKKKIYRPTKKQNHFAKCQKKIFFF